MQSRDYIGKMIDAMARAIASLAGFKAKGQLDEGIAEIKRVSQQNLSLDIDSVADFPYFQIVKVLKDDRGMNNEELTAAATCFTHLGDFEMLRADTLQAVNYFKKALVLLRYLQENDVKNYYLARDAQILHIEDCIRKLNT